MLHGAFPAGEFIGTTAVDAAIPPVTIECVPTWPLTNASLRHSDPTATSPLAQAASAVSVRIGEIANIAAPSIATTIGNPNLNIRFFISVIDKLYPIVPTETTDFYLTSSGCGLVRQHGGYEHGLRLQTQLHPHHHWHPLLP